jgi:hypothetical protein
MKIGLLALDRGHSRANYVWIAPFNSRQKLLLGVNLGVKAGPTYVKFH